MKFSLEPAQLNFLENQHSAAMITLRSDGSPHVAQVGVALVQGPDGDRHLMASGTQRRLRTRYLRRDPRCTLFVFQPPLRWLALETTVTLIEGLNAHIVSARLLRTILGLRPEQKIPWGGKEVTDDELVAALTAEQRLIYQFEIHAAYGEPTR